MDLWHANDRVFGADRCTAILIGKDASTTGSPLTTHTADCAECDWRVNKVPAKDWPAGSMRPVHLISGSYPRQVREDRGETWSKANLEDMPQRKNWEDLENKLIIGYIPQVSHTYALIEGLYGIMNEHQVAIGESTCSAKFFAAPVSAGGKALLEVSELSQIALERSKTAREAILTMGELAEKYGYYSAEWNVGKYGKDFALGEGGEALTVIDTDEAWMFHILPDDTGASAIWAAQRIPPNHVSAVANTFVIKEIIPNHPDFLYSQNLYPIAQKNGWYEADRDGPYLHFLRTYSPQRYHPNYSNRRVWRVLSQTAPDLLLPPNTNAYADDYPVSVPLTRTTAWKDDGTRKTCGVPPPAITPGTEQEQTLATTATLSSEPFLQKLSPVDVMWMQRDHYENTIFSTTEGLAAGPFGDPNRFDLAANGNMTIFQANEGEFQRAISLFRTSYSFVAEPRHIVTKQGDVGHQFARLWLSQYAPDSSTYTPLYIQSDKLPKAFISGTMQKFDSNSAWWNFCLVGNYAGRFYSYAMQGVRAVQYSLEESLWQSSTALESELLTLLSSGANTDSAAITARLTAFTVESGEHVSSTWRDFFPKLVTTYRDAYVVSGQEDTTVSIRKMFYPKWWLERVGFFDVGGNKDGILFMPNPLPALNNDKTPHNQVLRNYSTSEVGLFGALLFVMLLVGMFIGRKTAQPHNTRKASVSAEYHTLSSQRVTQSAASFTGDLGEDEDDEDADQSQVMLAYYYNSQPPIAPASSSSSYQTLV